MSEFILNKIETRSTTVGGMPTYIIKGYATTPNHTYAYKSIIDKSTGAPIRKLKEYFTDAAIERIKNKAKKQKVFVDLVHETHAKESTKMILANLQKKFGKDVSEEIAMINDKFKNSEIPMFKIEDFKIDDKGMFVEIHGNPYYRELSEDHRKYFDGIWGSLENKFINGISFNMKPTVTVINDGLQQVDDADVYGISLTDGASNDQSDITEVVKRSMEIVRGEQTCQKKRKMQMSSLMM